MKKAGNSPLYSPLKKMSEDMSNVQTMDESLVSRQPCLNGYTNTVDKIGSQYNNQNSIDDATSPKKDGRAKTSKFGEVQSPGLKHALHSSEKGDKKTKLSIFQNEKYRTGSIGAEEERKYEK